MHVLPVYWFWEVAWLMIQVSATVVPALHISELTEAERADMLDSFLLRVRSSSIDIPASLNAGVG